MNSWSTAQRSAALEPAESAWQSESLQETISSANLTGISRFVGILEVKSRCYTDTTPVWLDEIFPIRFDVELVEKLDAKTAVPVLSLKDELQLFKGLKSRNAWTGFFRGSPAEFCASDGEAIASAIKNAAKNPVELEYDERKYRRKTKTYDSKIGIVTVPDDHEEDPSKALPEETTHEEIQWLLLKLGSDQGLDVWVSQKRQEPDAQRS